MADSITSRLLRQFGLTGSGAASSTMIPTPKSPMAIDAYSRRYEEAGAVTNPDIWQKYSLAMRRPVTYDSMLQLWDEMSGWDLMAAAMVEIVEEATQTDDTTPHPIFYECNDSQFEEDLNNMLLKLDADSLVPSQVWYTAGFGNSFEKLDYDKGEGVTGMTFAHPMEVRRYWMERNRQCIGFRWAGRNPDKTAAYSHADGATIDRAAVNSDSGKTEPLWYPWDFCMTPDTKVKLLDGRNVAVEDLAKEYGEGEFWVYSSTPEGRMVPGRAHSLHLTRKDADVVEIELDNGEKVRFTPDHPFMLRDGTYRNAGDLKPGDSLMPLYTKHSTYEEHGRDGYEMYFDNKRQKWAWTHWRVAEVIHGTKRDEKGKFAKSFHVHHVDFDRQNNAPSNLRWMTAADHNKLHRDVNADPIHKEKQRKAASEALKRTWELRREEMCAHSSRNRIKTVEKRLKATGSKVTPSQRAASVRNGMAVGYSNKGRIITDPAQIEQRRQASVLGKLALKRKRFELVTRNCAELACIVSQPGKPIPSHTLSHLSEQEFEVLCLIGRGRTTSEIAQIIGVSPGTVHPIRAHIRAKTNLRDGTELQHFAARVVDEAVAPINHKVVSVTPAGKSDVYDFTVDGEHNFAISAGVFVHNCHFRRLYRMRFTEHGEPIFDEAQGIYKKLRMAIDQMVVHRAQIQPDRYVVNVDVAELPPRDQMMMVQRWKQSLRSKLSFGSGDSSAPDEFKAIYNPWALDTVLWMAKPKGFTHSIERLAGTSVVPDVYDIELLQNLFFSILGMPKWWVMGQTGQASAPSGKALLASDIRFLRKVKAIQKPIKHGYTWLGYFHALLKGKDISQLDIQAKMPPVGSLEDQAKVETLKAQTEVLAAMGEVMNTYGLPREAWIDVIFKQYMHLPDDVVNVFLTALPPESEGGQMESIKESKAYRHNSTRVVLDEIERQYGKQHPSIQGAVRRIHSALDGKIAPENSTQFKTVESVLGISASSKTVVQLLEGKPDYIRSSYQRDEAPLAKSPEEMQQIHESVAPSGFAAPEGATGPYYRKWIRPAPRT